MLKGADHEASCGSLDWPPACRLRFAGAASAQDITIGVAGPMTGQYASFGQQFKNGATMAIADINAAGGVLGKKLAMNIQDDACDPKQARSVAEKLVRPMCRS